MDAGRDAGNEQPVPGSDEDRPQEGQDITKRAAGHKFPGARSAFRGVARTGLEKFQLGALLHPDHVANMGAAVWVFLWLWSNAKVDQGPLAGEVFAGRPFSLDQMAHELGMSKRTAVRHLCTLRDHGYVHSWREGQCGISAVVCVWRPDLKATDEGPNGDDHPPDNNPPKDVYNAISGALKPEIYNAKYGATTHGENKSAISGALVEVYNAKYGALNEPHNAKYGALTQSKCVPPLLTPPYKEFVKRVYEEPTTTTVVPFERGKTRTVPVAAGVAEGNQGGECRRASHASKALDKELSLIPGHERPIRTKTLERAFLDLSPHDIGLVFDAVRRERTTSTWLENPPGWWASLLHEQAWTLKKQRSKERNEEGDL